MISLLREMQAPTTPPPPPYICDANARGNECGFARGLCAVVRKRQNFNYEGVNIIDPLNSSDRESRLALGGGGAGYLEVVTPEGADLVPAPDVPHRQTRAGFRLDDTPPPHPEGGGVQPTPLGWSRVHPEQDLAGQPSAPSGEQKAGGRCWVKKIFKAKMRLVPIF